MFVTRQYYPHGDATSRVVHHLAAEFIRRGWDAAVLALATCPEDVEVREWEGVHVENLCVPGSMDREQFRNGLKHDFFGTMMSAGKLAASILGGKNEGLGLAMNPLSREALRKGIVRIRETGEIDLCIATLMPAEAAAAAMDALAAETVFAVYQLDTFWNNESLQAKCLENRKRFEKRMIGRADFVVTTPLIRQANEIAFPEQRGKIVSAEFPMIRKPEGSENAEDPEELYTDGRTHCVFPGRLYQTFRPPEKVVRIILGMESVADGGIVFDFYGTGQHLVRAVLEKENALEDTSRIQLHGVVPSAEAERAIRAADFLVNIDNTTKMQVPSKIFEYISTGKPVINFYYNEDSPTISYLERYPNCVNIYLNGDPDAEMRKLEAFLAAEKGRRIPFPDVQALFGENTPETVCGIFCREYSAAKHRKNGEIR